MGISSCFFNALNLGGNALKSARSSFLPALAPRFFAMGCVVLLIGVLSLIGILGIAVLGPTLGHGENVSHADGVIMVVSPSREFTLKTATGQLLTFECGQGCRASLAHMIRHRNEKAHTDVYYIEGAHQTLMALDVD